MMQSSVISIILLAISKNLGALINIFEFIPVNFSTNG